jgi:hypothetical protein
MAMSAQKPVKRLVFQNLQDNSTVVTLRSVEQLRQTESEIVAVAAGIAAGQFGATPGKHCDWCGYRTVCPEVEAKLPARERETRGGEIQLTLFSGAKS